MDRLDAIAAFVAVADRQGFAPASRALNLSPSAVTRLVAALEAHLGVRLLQRTTRAVHLTDSGARFLERARRLLDDLADAERMAENERATPAGRLSVAAPLIFGRLHVAPLVCDYMSAWPAVTVDLQLADRMVNLIEEGVDVALRIGHLADSNVVARRLGSTRKVLVAAPGYLESRPAPTLPHALSGHRLIACTALTIPKTWVLQHEGKPVEIPADPVYVTNSVDAAIHHAINAGGITQVLMYQVAEHLRTGALQILLAGHEPAPMPIQFVYPTARLLSPKVRALIDMAAAGPSWHFA